MMHERRSPRTLYVIAPTMMECVLTARDFGISEREIENHRNVTRANDLRGVSPGTPYIARSRSCWSVTPEAEMLGEAMDALIRQGRLRPARDDEMDNWRAFAGVAMRKAGR